MPRQHHPFLPQNPLFGRHREVSVLRESLLDALAGCGRLILIGGAAGIGKTTLTQALCQHAEEQGALARVGSCYDLTVTPPYGPWLELVADLPTGSHPPPLSHPDRSGVTQHSTSADVVFSDVLDYLQSAAAQHPLVLVLEDLHWSDAASLELLRYTARHIADSPILVIATYRDADLDRRHPLNQFLLALTRESQATLLNLRPLDDEAVRSLVRHRYDLSGSDEQRLIDYLQNRAQGNPFFIFELLRMLEEERVIASDAGGWQLGNLARTSIPPLVRQLIEERLSRLSRQERELLAVASVIGQHVPLDIWRSVATTASDDLSSTIRHAFQLHLLEESHAAPTTLRFTHALVRETLYFDVDLTRRSALHRAIGEALAHQPAPDPDAVAHHFVAGGHELAAEWLMLAGERAQRVYAWRSAAERFEAALAAMEAGSAARARGWLLYRIGLLLRYADPDRGIAVLGEAERVGQQVQDSHLEAYARADRGLIRCLVGDVRRGLAEMRAGAAMLDGLPTLNDPQHVANGGAAGSRLSVESIRQGAVDLIGSSDDMNIRHGALIFWLAWAGRYAEAVAIGEPYVRHSPNADAKVQDALGDAFAGLGHAYAALGRPDEALNAFARARETYQSIDHHFKVGNTAIYELSEAFIPYRADRLLERQWLAHQAEDG
jgi:tetratricopeptide (TPR) repeat protein